MRPDFRTRAQCRASRAIVKGRPMGPKTVFRIRAVRKDTRGPWNGSHRPRGSLQNAELWYEHRRVRPGAET